MIVPLTTEINSICASFSVLKELGHFFSNNPAPDYITFSGAGEPTLHSHLGDVLKFLKKSQPDIPVAVLTNGSLLGNPIVRKELLKADVVLPSLDAATERSFRRINRPFSSLRLEDYIQGLIDFRIEFQGEIWLEIFILPGYNDDSDDINALKDALLKIKP